MGKKRTEPEQPEFDVDQIAEDAKENFDLRARLLGAPKLEKTVTVYTDAVTGKALGGNEPIMDGPIKSGMNRRWGVLGRLADLEEQAAAILKDLEQPDIPEETKAELEARVPELEKEMADLQKKAKTLSTKLEKSALVFTLRAVPDLLLRDSHRRARKEAGIRAKGNQGLTVEQNEAYTAERTAIILSASVFGYVDNATKRTYNAISVEDAKALRDFLPPGQFAKLDRAMYALSMESNIGQNATDDPDF